MCRVSVIIPYYNRGNTLPRALDSVLAQTYKDWEIILVNDGSTDQCEQVVEAYIQAHPDIRFKHISQSNMGPSAARNNGIRQAEGQYIAFLDSDDSWESQKLEIQIAFMQNNPDVAITGTNYYIANDHSQNRYPLKPSIIEGDFYRMLFKVFYVTSSVVIQRKVFSGNNIWFRVGKHQGEDLLLFLQIQRSHRGVRLSIPLVNYDRQLYGDGGLSDDLSKLLSNGLDNLKILFLDNRHSQKKISYFLLLVLNCYTYLKHGKRRLKTSWYKRKSRE